MFNQIDEMELTKKILYSIGLEIQSNTNALIDQETGTQINFDGKVLKANTDPNKQLYISKYDVKLEPANPKCTKLIERLFGYFIDREYEEENIAEMKAYYFDKDFDNNKYRLCIKFADGVKWVGEWYNNKIFGYIQAILQINGAFSHEDLSPFDIIYDDEELNTDD